MPALSHIEPRSAALLVMRRHGQKKRCGESAPPLANRLEVAAREAKDVHSLLVGPRQLPCAHELFQRSST